MQSSVPARIVNPGRAPELISRARALLAEAKTLTEILHVRGLAKAAEQFIKAARHSGKLANDAAEIRLRAERRAGEMLIEMGERGERAKQSDGRPSSKEALHVARLSDLGIEYTQSHRWQRIAQVLEPIFEDYIQREKARETSELTAVKLLNEAKLAKRDELAAEIRKAPPPLPDGPFQVIVIDPPWPYVSRDADPMHRSRNPYPAMPLKEIHELKVPAKATDDAIVWLWTTNAFIQEAFECLKVWGFEQKTILTWVKNQIGTGDWLRGRTEHCLMAARGKPLVTLTNQSTALVADRGAHSEKPDEFYQLVDSLCPGSKLEMFARRRREGWEPWGAEIDEL